MARTAGASFLLAAEGLRRPVGSSISKGVSRHSAQSCCPWNERFAQEPKEPAFAPREVIAGKDARTLAEDLLAMSKDEFSAACRKSPVMRAKLAGR